VKKNIGKESQVKVRGPREDKGKNLKAKGSKTGHYGSFFTRDGRRHETRREHRKPSASSAKESLNHVQREQLGKEALKRLLDSTQKTKTGRKRDKREGGRGRGRRTESRFREIGLKGGKKRLAKGAWRGIQNAKALGQNRSRGPVELRKKGLGRGQKQRGKEIKLKETARLCCTAHHKGSRGGKLFKKLEGKVAVEGEERKRKLWKAWKEVLLGDDCEGEGKSPEKP